jgi:hypothetical protein
MEYSSPDPLRIEAISSEQLSMMEFAAPTVEC